MPGVRESFLTINWLETITAAALMPAVDAGWCCGHVPMATAEAASPHVANNLSAHCNARGCKCRDIEVSKLRSEDESSSDCTLKDKERLQGRLLRSQDNYQGVRMIVLGQEEARQRL